METQLVFSSPAYRRGFKKNVGNLDLKRCIAAGFTLSTKSQRWETFIQQRRDGGQIPRGTDSRVMETAGMFSGVL